MKSFKLGMALSSLLFNTMTPEIHKHKVSFMLSLCYEIDTVELTCKSIALYNSNNLYCVCGKDPLLIMIMYGNIQGYCADHIPEMNAGLGYALQEVSHE